MATVVSQIISAMESDIATELGASWSELTYKWDVQQNHFRDNDQMYGVIPQDASDGFGILKNYTLTHNFQVILVRSYVDRSDESDLQSKINDIYDNMSELIKKFLSEKAGIPAIVAKIDVPSLDEPEIITEDNIVILRGTFPVSYREAF